MPDQQARVWRIRIIRQSAWRHTGLYLKVQESRPLSNYIAEQYGIKHESPQAFIFTNGNVKWHASHSQITAQALAEKQQIIRC